MQVVAIGDPAAAMAELRAYNELVQLNFPECMDELERQHFENLLFLRAMVRGWTGDPLQQPPTSVLAAYAQMKREREGSRESGRGTGRA